MTRKPSHRGRSKVQAAACSVHHSSPEEEECALAPISYKEAAILEAHDSKVRHRVTTAYPSEIVGYEYG